MRKRNALRTSLALAIALAAGGRAQVLPGGLNTLAGTVYAPAGQDVAGTLVVACYPLGEDCDEERSRVVEIAEHGASATFTLSDVGREGYTLFASKDTDGDGVHFEDGDLYILLGADGRVTPPARGLELHLQILGAAPTATAAGAPAPAANSVTGVVLDTLGRPIEGARVWIDPGLTTGLVQTRTGPDGRYRAEGLLAVPYNAKAWTEVEYNGQRFCLRLGMDGPSAFDSFVPGHGVERDFRWQLTGPIEDLRDFDGYFGGQLRVMNTGFYQEAHAVEFLFTPTGPRIDGSAGEAFTRTLEFSRPTTDLFDIPVGPYTVTAVLVARDGSRSPLALGPDIFDTGRPALPIDWDSDGMCGNGNGVSWNYVWLDNPYE